MTMRTAKPRSKSQPVRCAIYTRKSSEEGLDQDFNSLDAQREAAEAYIASQRHAGWVCIAETYDDGGFTGGNMKRPALAKLMVDIEVGRVDCVVVYKVDRLSRSLLDFARMMATFEEHQVAFVSITQQFNTASSMGRLVLNVLLSFAQFEREIISERTRDKIAATRRKGKWCGGVPILGYDVDRNALKLVVNDKEAAQVREIFELYAGQRALSTVVAELGQREWCNKRWTTRKGTTRGGRPFTKTTLHYLLTNVTYAGKVRYKEEVHEGEHETIVDEALFEQVRRLLKRNGRGSGNRRMSTASLLKGRLFCAACRCAMTPSFATKGRRRYRYYVCTRAQKQGRAACSSQSLPAAEIERFVREQIETLRHRPDLDAPRLETALSEGLRGLVERVNYDRPLALKIGLGFRLEVRVVSSRIATGAMRHLERTDSAQGEPSCRPRKQPRRRTRGPRSPNQSAPTR